MSAALGDCVKDMISAEHPNEDTGAGPYAKGGVLASVT